jgi:glucan phosphoethanolaminetransferase (alkaline phosphatase superfamily)
MIQRIQSVFLLLLALSMLSLLALPLWHKVDGLTHQELTLTAFNFTAQHMPKPATGAPVWIIGLLALVSAAVAVYEIFQFRNRFLQLKLGMLNLLLLVATFGAAFYFSNQGEALLNPKLEGQFQPAFYLPTLGLMLNLLANRFIRRDEQLVRNSYDRLR